MKPCLVCGTAIPDENFTTNNLPEVLITCPRCGEFALTGTAIAVMVREGDGIPNRRAITSHAIRRMQRDAGPRIFEDQLRAIWRKVRLPTPLQQCDRFLILVGTNQPSSGRVARLPIAQAEAEIGLVLRKIPNIAEDFEWLLQHLKSKHLAEIWPTSPPGTVDIRLTSDGWTRYEELQHKSPESRTAFMAMKFGHPRSDVMFRDHFIRAVDATDFKLERLDTRPKAGLLDARLEVEIRTAKFVIADLTHGNRGAYWEAGFAAGLGKPVFYTCEREYFRRAGAHFDTNHYYIIMWDILNPKQAVDDLKAAIRATLPADAKLTDD
jgi:hypothetical protein